MRPADRSALSTPIPLLSCLAGLVLLLPAPAQARQAPPAHEATPAPALSQPTLHPEGTQIAFVHGGDIWTVPAAGGEARLLVGGDAHDHRPLYAPDGTRLAFVSDRAGSDDLYVLDLSDGEILRLTWDDGNASLDAWSPDGRWLYYSTSAMDLGGNVDVQKVPSGGGTPVEVAAEAYTSEYFAAPSPDGERLALSGRARMAFGQWWRNGSSHIDQAEIWIRAAGVDGDPGYRRFTEPGSRNLWGLWTDGGRALVYMSDRSGTENLWIQPLDDGPATPLTEFTDGRVLWPSISADGQTVAFERDFGIWRMELPDGTPRRVEIRLHGGLRGPLVEHHALTQGFSDLSLSPDGAKVAFVARGEVFAASAEDGGIAFRVTRTPAAESQLAWGPESRRVAYVSLRTPDPGIFVYDFEREEESRITTGEDATPRFSPDGDALAFVREGRELRVRTLATGEERVLATGGLWRTPFTGARPLAWSPDGRWIAFLATDDRMFTNAWVVPVDGGEARPVSRLANSFGGSVDWAPDGRALYFDTQHRTEEGRIARIDLLPRTPEFRETAFRELFEPDRPPEGRPPGAGDREADEEAPDPAPVEIRFEGIFDRLSLLPMALDVGTLTVSPDGKQLVFTASSAGQTNLYAWSLDELAEGPRVPRPLTATPGGKGLPWFTPDGRRVFYLGQGRIHSVPLEAGSPSALSVTAELETDFHSVKREVFREAWTLMRDHFYDEAMHGADWGRVGEAFAPPIAAAGDRREMGRLVNLMLGELDASHLGIGLGGSGGPSTGRLGLRFDPAEQVRTGRLRIRDLLPLGPAAVAGGIEVGDYLVSVDGTPLTADSNLQRHLENTVGRRVVLEVTADPDGGARRTVALRPIGTGNARQLRYRAWVEDRRAHVDRVSGGRLGYVHMADMSWNALQQLTVDLDAENFAREGVVVDLRGNNGGFVNAYALDVFAREGYLTMEIRDAPEVPARSMLGQRALEAPTALLIDMNSLSDAEDFTEGYRALGLGPVVGEPTAGWIIYTWSAGLVDGSSLRMPRSRIRGAAGDEMERNPRPVDHRVERHLGEEAAGTDRQLEAAVRILLERLGGG